MKLQKAIQNLNLTVEKLYGSISPSHNSKGELQYSDFEGLISMIDKECSNETIVYLFQKIDQDDSKTISYDEFQLLFFDTDFNEYVVFKDPFLEEKKENILISLKAILEKTGSF